MEISHQLFEQYRDRVDFLAIYIVEAHAKDEWPLGHKRSCIPQHKTLQDRIEAGMKEYCSSASYLRSQVFRVTELVPNPDGCG